MVFALQKYGFCRAKRWFLHCKKWVFILPTINIRGTTTVLVLYEHYVTANRSPRNWQSVSSRRGRFIVPAYMKTPTKWRTEMRVRWNEYTYLIMWKHIFDDVNTRFCLCQDTGTMNRPLRLTVCSLRISRIVCWHFVECSPRNWQSVRSRRVRFIAPAYMKTPTKWRTEMRLRWNEYTYLIM